MLFLAFAPSVVAQVMPPALTQGLGVQKCQGRRGIEPGHVGEWRLLLSSNILCKEFFIFKIFL